MDSDELKDLPRSERIAKLFDFQPFPYQADLIDKADNNDVFKSAVKPGRQVGKTETGGAIAAERALSGHDVMILGPFEDTVSEMMEAARNHLEACEQKFANAGYELGTEYRNKTDWKFQGNGRLRARTVGSDGTQIRGKNPDVVLIDEDAYIKDSIHTEVIEPFFSTHKTYEYYLFSTPAGKTGYFYEKVEQDESFFSPHWPSEISPLIDKDWLEQKRKELDGRTYQQEYLGEFVDEGEALFPHDVIQPLTADVSLSGPKFLGVDIAREGSDRTVYTAIDETGSVEILAAEETSTMDGVLGRIRDLHREHTFETIVVEENSIGGGVVDFGRDMADVMQPFKSTSKSKHQLYKRLQKDIEGEEITLPNNRRLIDELTSLEFEFTQHGYMKVSHPEGGHDDYPDSLAFANWGRNGAGQTQISRRSARTSMQKRNL